MNYIDCQKKKKKKAQPFNILTLYDKIRVMFVCHVFIQYCLYLLVYEYKFWGTVDTQLKGYSGVGGIMYYT